MTNSDTYTWEEINATLMSQGMSASRIFNFLIALNKVCKLRRGAQK